MGPSSPPTVTSWRVAGGRPAPQASAVGAMGALHATRVAGAAGHVAARRTRVTRDDTPRARMTRTAAVTAGHYTGCMTPIGTHYTPHLNTKWVNQNRR